MRPSSRTPVPQSGEEPGTEENATYGAAWSPPNPNHCRIIIGNISSFPNHDNKVKQGEIRDILTESNVFMFNEHNRTRISSTQLRSVLPSSYGKNSYQCENIESPRGESYMPGGTGIVLDSGLRNYIHKSGGDSRRMGRWTWYTLRGRHDKVTTIVSIYKCAHGFASYWNQLSYIRHLSTLEDSTVDPRIDPIDLWFKDLSELIENSSSEGAVIVAGDFNENLHDQSGRVQTLMRRLGLRDCFASYSVLPKHTWDRGNNRRIDGAFSTIPIRASYSGFDRSPSDHMWMSLEVSISDLLGFQHINFPSPPKKKVTSKNILVQEKYNHLLQKQVEIHKLKEKRKDLEDMMLTDAPLSLQKADSQRLLNIIAEQTYRALQHANNKCRKIREGKQAFSSNIKHLRIQLKFFTLFYHRQHPQFVSPRKSQVQRFAKLSKYVGHLNLPHKEVKLLMDQAKKKLNSMIPSAKQLREEFLKSLSIAKSATDGSSAVTHLKEMIRRERQAITFASIRKAVGKIRGPPLVAIEKDTPQGRVLITNIDEQNKEIISCHKSKLMAANNTPLRQFPLSSWMGESGDFQRWEQLVQGLHLPKGIDPDIVHWMKHLQGSISASEEIWWSPQEYYESWKLMKEETGSGPGPTFAFIKSVYKDSEVMALLSTIALVPMQTGIIPTVWKTSIEQCIPKKVEDLRPTKLRRITLFNAQLNHNKKLIGKRMMSNGERNGTLAAEQYGSRHGKSSVQHAINKRLTLDWMRITRTPGIYIANDAKGCYDRILLIVAYLTMRRYGIPAPTAQFAIKSLIEMRYSVRTAWGVSEQTYGGPEWIEEFDKIPTGAGQGSGDGPALWAGISSPLFDIMRAAGHCFSIKSAITLSTLKMAGFGFVDDTDGIRTVDDDTPLHLLHAKTQKGSFMWEKLIRTTGGALEPSKSDWVWIQQQWQDGRWKYIDPDLPPLLMHGEEGLQPMPRLLSTDARMTLGIYQSITGSEDREYEYLQEKIAVWCTKLTSSNVTRNQAQLGTSVTISATLRYALPATCLSSIQCNNLQKLLRKNVLPRLGVVRTAPLTLVHGTERYGGFNLPSIRLLQCSAHIQFILQHGGLSSVEGQLIQANTESLLLEAGHLVPLFNLPATIPWISISWLWFTIKEANHFQFNLHGNTQKLHSWREHDSGLMEEMYTTLHLSDKEWRILNHVRVYMRVVTTSDIVDSAGTHILPGILEGISTWSPSRVAYEWPASASYITLPEIKIWKRCIRHTFLQHTTTRLHLQYRLGKWKSTVRPYCTWWQDLSGALYKRDLNRCHKWTVPPSCRDARIRTYELYLETPLPPNAVPTMVVPGRTNQVQCNPIYHPILEAQVIEPEHWSLRHLHGSESSKLKLASAIANRTAQFMSDGSFKDGVSSSCFLSVADHSVGGTNILPGHPADMSAHRGEMGGTLGLIKYVHRLCTEHNITNGHVTAGTDCLNVKRFACAPFHTPPTTSCYDICNEIYTELSTSPVTWTFVHIEGHQDDHVSIDDLDPWALANIAADTGAKQAMVAWIHSGRPRISFPPSLWGVSLEDGAIRTTRIQNLLVETHLEPPMEQLWVDRLLVTDCMTEEIHWSSFTKSMRAASPAERRFRSKHMAHISATGVNMRRRGHAPYDVCPHCGEREDNAHIFVCTAPIPTDIVEAHLPRLRQFLSTCNDPDLAASFYELFLAARNPMRRRPAIPLSHPFSYQRSLGPLAFQWGLFITPVVKYLEHRWRGTRKSASNWFASLGTLNWGLLKNLWRARNKVAHSASSQVHALEAVDIDNTLTTLYHDIAHIPGRLLPRGDWAFFSRSSLADILASPLLTRRKWLRQALRISAAWSVHNSSSDARLLLEYLMKYPPETSTAPP